jgi:bifunctional DNA-binding transcriptional regulator/antitoxin component of YhaV-PrlF toxin-antitoxin module
MRHWTVSSTTPLTNRGSLTLPPSLRRKMGLDKLRNPMFVVEERDATDMDAFRAVPRKAKQ